MRRTKGRTPASSAARATLVAVTLTFASQRPARAQDSTTHVQDSSTTRHASNAMQRDGWIVGPLVGLPGAGHEVAYPLVTLGLGVTRLQPDQMGLDFAIGTAPYALAFGVVPIAARIGASIPLTLGPDAFFIPSAGFSGILIASPEDGTAIPGWYAGAATVVAHGPLGFRVGVTIHEPFERDAQPVWLAEIGVMHVPLPRLTH